MFLITKPQPRVYQLQHMLHDVVSVAACPKPNDIGYEDLLKRVQVISRDRVAANMNTGTDNKRNKPTPMELDEVAVRVFWRRRGD